MKTLRILAVMAVLLSFAANLFGRIEGNKFPLGFNNYAPNSGKKIKKITTTTYDKWRTVSLFDKDGNLVHEQTFYKGKLKADNAYDYVSTDSLLTVKATDTSGSCRRLAETCEDYLSPSGKCYKRRVYMNGSDTASLFVDNFVYDDNLLISNEEANTWQKSDGKSRKVNYYYNEKKQLILKTRKYIQTDSTFYSYDSKGRLTDEIVKADKAAVLSGVVPFAPDELNKYHIRYADFDSEGNWEKSYFVTRKGKKLHSTRSVEYW